MDVDLIFKIAAIGIIVSVLNQVLVRSGSSIRFNDHHGMDDIPLHPSSTK